ncbi:MAG TPA: hypothetical protein VLS96_20020 [Nodosilinea sp.]|nr:hypothetical protein [Nodosilinea sp.]
MVLASSPAMLDPDALPIPPVLRHGGSPAGTYHLVLTLTDADGQRRTVASLYEITDQLCAPLWTQPLPHSYGPRLALVNDAGLVVLLDEWINVASPYAIVVLDPRGEVMAQHGFDDIVAATGATRAEVVDRAAQGFWLGGDPEFSRAGDRLFIPAAGGRLTLDLTTGDLTF